MKYLAPILLAAGVVGCNDTAINPNRIEGELFANPINLLDWGDRTIGTPHVASLELYARRAPVTITGITVRSTTRQGTFFDAATFARNFGADALLGDLADTDVEVVASSWVGRTMNAEELAEMDLVFLSETAGYFQGSLEIAHDGRGRVIEVPIRARAAKPCSSIFPHVIEFGQIDPGSESCRNVKIQACGALALTVTEVSFQGSDFRTTADLPFTVPRGQERELPVCFSPSDSRPAASIVNFFSGEEALMPVTLRANDCRNGLPREYDRDNDGYTVCGGDCDDNDPSVNPAGREGLVPNGKDDNCNGTIDETTRGYDDDGDGYCDDPSSCLQPGVLPGDCNDGDPNVNPGMEEIMGNGIDDNCDGTVDNGTTDGDGDGYSVDGEDCDDNDATVYPGAIELVDLKDNNCNGFIDEGTVAFDNDGDGFCAQAPCSDGSTGGDCDDEWDRDNPRGPNHPGAVTYPGAPEIPDGRDNNCNGIVDEGTDWYDDDGDGYTELGGDCNDNDPNIGPHMLEIPNNGIDDNCNGQIDEPIPFVLSAP